MQLSDNDLRQIDDTYLERLGNASLRSLSSKLLHDLKEARERLNQNSRNSSIPPSREAPWEKPPAQTALMPEDARLEDEQEERRPSQADDDAEQEKKPAPQAKVKLCKRAGKVEGAQGYGRPAPQRVDVVEPHAVAQCTGCCASLTEHVGQAYTGYYEVDWVRNGFGWAVRITKHLFEECTCECGHVSRAQPFRGVEDGVDIGGFRLIGPGLASLIVALSKRYRMSHLRIQEFLHDWLDVWISTGAIHESLRETAAIVAPLEKELVKAVEQSKLLHADETPWPEQGASSLWLWVFISSTVVLYYVSHRGQELVRNLLEDFKGVLMSDGWQSYRWLPQRLRCWEHLKRKAQGLAESLDTEAQGFGKEVLVLWNELQNAVRKAREGPPGVSLRSEWEQRLQVFRARCEVMQGYGHDKTRALAIEFLNDWEAIFRILENPFWPLTNNEAERALRHWVILRQISHGTRTPEGSRRFALLASVIDTCRQRGHSPWPYLQNTIARRRQGLDILPLPA